MKQCNTCKENKNESEFSLRKNGTRVARCKKCHAAYLRNYYANNKDKYREKNKRDLPRYVDRNNTYIINYLLEHPCVDCGETDLEVLEFDHRDSIGKDRKTSLLSLGNVWSIERIQEEIDKCDVRCSNCHTRRTRKQFGVSRTEVAQKLGLV